MSKASSAANRSLVVALCLALTGCGALHNTAYRSESTDNLKVIAVDAKQRFAFIKTEPNGTKSIVCPEPSPDALSAGAISLSVDASKDQLAEIKAAIASAEQATSIGLRTQSISLLRDQLAYMCLLRMADSRADLDADAYLLLFKRYQAAVLGVLAIEQLTGAVRVPPVQVSATGNATVVVEGGKKTADQTTADDKASGEATGASKKGAAAPEDGESNTDAMSKVDPKKVVASVGAAVKAASDKTGSGKVVSTKAVANGAQATGVDQNSAAAKSKDTGRSGSAQLNASTATGEISKAVVSPGGSSSDMAVVSQTVFNIVELIVTKSFQFENCYAANSRATVASTVENSCPAAQRIDMCARLATREYCEEKVLEVETNAFLRTGNAENPNVARAEASVALQRQANVAIPADIPLEAMRFGIFRCSGTNDKFVQQMRSLLVSKGVPERRIALREISDAELKDKGFDVSVGAQVLYDPGVTSEVKAAPQFVAYAQSVIEQLKGAGRAFASPNSKESTPLYMSVMLCQR